jgi:serine/threonine-protein kinase
MSFDLRPGQVIDGLEVKRLLGRGGMGAVYLVHNPRVRADRALKVISAGDVSDSARRELEQRFANEAAAAASLAHENIVNVFDFKELTIGNERLVYLLMEYFPSVDLKAWLSQERPSLDRVLHVSRQIARALAKIHAAGLLHRDIKLGNILIGQDDHIKVADFGLAKNQLSDEDHLTRTGVSVGTKPYFAPEYLRAAQFGNPQHTQLSDLWAVGIVLYYLATHHHPFEAPQQDLIVVRILAGKYLPVDALRSDISDEFAAVIHDLLKDDPTQRTQTAKQLIAALDAVPAASDPNKAPFSQVGPPVARQPAERVKEAMPQAPSGSGTAPARLAAAPAVPVNTKESSSQRDDNGWSNLSELDAAFSRGLQSVDSQQAASRGGDLSGFEPLNMSAPPRERAKQPETAVARPQQKPPLVVELSLPPQGIDSQFQPPSERGSDASALAALDNVIRGDRQASSFGPTSKPSSSPSPSNPNPPPPVLESTASDEPSLLPLPTVQYSPPPAPKKENTKFLRSLVPAVAAAVIVFGGGALVMKAAGAAADRKKKPVAFVDPDEQRQKQSANEAIKDLEALNKKDSTLAPVVLRPAAPAPTLDTPPSPEPAAPPPPTHTSSASQRVAQARAAKPVEPAPAPAPVPAEDAWAARFGRRSLNTGAVAQGGAAQPVGAPQPAATAGTKIPVRIEAMVASSPPQPVIAITTAPVQLGARTLPAGTQIHGRTSGASGPRILMAFSFALVGGAQVPLKGQALGLDGRAGLPGAKNLGGGSDVVGGAVTGAARGVTNALADAAGNNVVGDAIRGGGNQASNKGERLNNEENIVTANKGSRFVIYIDDSK